MSRSAAVRLNVIKPVLAVREEECYPSCLHVSLTHRDSALITPRSPGVDDMRRRHRQHGVPTGGYTGARCLLPSVPVHVSSIATRPQQYGSGQVVARSLATVWCLSPGQISCPFDTKIVSSGSVQRARIAAYILQSDRTVDRGFALRTCLHTSPTTPTPARHPTLNPRVRGSSPWRRTPSELGFLPHGRKPSVVPGARWGRDGDTTVGRRHPRHQPGGCFRGCAGHFGQHTGVRVGGDPDGGVPKHLRDDLEVGAAGESQRRSSVAKIMKADGREVGISDQLNRGTSACCHGRQPP